MIDLYDDEGITTFNEKFRTEQLRRRLYRPPMQLLGFEVSTLYRVFPVGCVGLAGLLAICMALGGLAR